LLEKIDREVVAQHSSLELAKMTRALFAFVESGKMSPRAEFEKQTLPINAAIVFFEDKKLLDIQSRLEFERDKREMTQLTVEQLGQYIEIVRTGNENAPSVEPEAAAPPQTTSTLAAPAATASPEQALTLGSRAQPAEEQESSNVPAPAASKAPVLVFGENDEQYLASSPGLKQKEIRDLFNEVEHELIVRKIFNRDEPAFLGAITEISMQGEWEDVAHYLDALYLVNDVDPFGAEAVLFTDRLFAHYHPSKRK
jgi:hypothetical protein